MDRRSFLHAGAALTAAAGLRLTSPGSAVAAAAAAPERTPAAPLPRWRGFNLLEKFDPRHAAPFQEWDFRTIAGWGFDFVRLPLSYWCWSRPENPFRVDEAQLRDLDQALDFGRAHGVHVNLNLHRAPGYCVNPPAEPRSLWTDPAALEAFAFQWALLAGRYKGVPSSALSFDLLNEPPEIDAATYVRVMSTVVERIRVADPDRLIIVDGLAYGRTPVAGLVPLGVGQSTRGYDPFPVSHFGASWVKSEGWPVPTWPYREHGVTWDRAYLRERMEPWIALARQGVGIHVGEWGVYNRTPHDVALAYMRDHLAVWRDVGVGWALWNLRGAFGVLDSDRTDVTYEPFDGHRLDRAMLEVLRAG